MLSSIAEFFILILREFQELKLIQQLSMTIAFIGMPSSLAYLLFSYASRKGSGYAEEVLHLRKKLRDSETHREEQKQRIEALEKFDSIKVVAQIEHMDEVNDYELKLQIVNDYLQYHSSCLAKVYCILMEHQLAQVENGLEALLKSRYAAWGALAAKPTDNQLTATLAEVEAFIRIENAAPEDKDAVRMREELEIFRRALEENADDFHALYMFGQKLCRLSRHHFAEPVLRRAERVLLANGTLMINGETHFNVLHDIAFSMVGGGRYSKAEKFIRELLPSMEKVFNKKHPRVLRTRSNLAASIFYQGRYSEAEDLLHKLLPIQRKVLGSKHAAVLHTLSALAAIDICRGNNRDAEKQLRKVLEIQTKLFGKDNKNTLSTWNSLAVAVGKQGRRHEEEKLLLEILVFQTKIFGEEHETPLFTRLNLARSRGLQGRHVEEEQMLLEILPIQKQISGPQHPNVLRIRK